jgi:hypothetical protein
MEQRAGTFKVSQYPARRNPWPDQPTLTMDTIGAIGRVAAIFTLITPSPIIAKDFPIESN